MGNSRMEEEFIIANNVEELPLLVEKIEEMAERWGLSMPLTMNVNLVIEEAISNIIFYAFNDDLKHEISISLLLSGSRLTIIFEDEGIPFDPTSAPIPDINLPADERPVGGLGIFLISKIMDEVMYKREPGKNILTTNKKIQL